MIFCDVWRHIAFFPESCSTFNNETIFAGANTVKLILTQKWKSILESRKTHKFYWRLLSTSNCNFSTISYHKNLSQWFIFSKLWQRVELSAHENAAFQAVFLGTFFSYFLTICWPVTTLLLRIRTLPSISLYMTSSIWSKTSLSCRSMEGSDRDWSSYSKKRTSFLLPLTLHMHANFQQKNSSGMTLP